MEKILNESVGRLAKEIRKSGLKPKIISDLDKRNIHIESPEVKLNGKKTPGDYGKFLGIVKKTYGHEASKYNAIAKDGPEWERRNNAAKNRALTYKEAAKDYQRYSELSKKKENNPLTKIKNKLIKSKDASYDITGIAPTGQANKIAKAVRAINNRDKATAAGLTPKEWRTKMYEKKIARRDVGDKDEK